MINDLKDLEKLLKLLRKQGVTEIKLQGVELKLGDMPAARDTASNQEAPEGDVLPTDEEMAFYSSMPPVGAEQ